MSVEIEMDRNSKINLFRQSQLPNFDDGSIKGLQYRRGSRKLSITNEKDEPYLNNQTSEDEANEKTVTREEVIPYAPDGGYGWIIVLASFLSNAVLDGISLSQGSIMEHIQIGSGIADHANCTQEELKALDEKCKISYEITTGMYAFVSSTLLCVTLSVGPFISLLTDRFGFRKVGASGSIIAALGIFLSFIVSPTKPNIWALVFLFGGISGVGFGMMFQPSIVIVGIYFEKWRPLATGIAISGTGFGIFVFAPFVKFIANKWNWQGAYLVQAGITLLSLTFALLYAPLPLKKVTSKEVNRLRRPSYPLQEVEKFTVSSMVKAMGPLFTSPTFLLIAISGFITMFGFFAPLTYLEDKGRTELGLSEESANGLISIFGLANTFGRIIFGLISSHPSINALILSNGALTVAGIATLLLPLTDAYYQLVIYSIVFGFGIAIFTVLRSILVLQFIGLERFNNAFGLSLLFMGIGTLMNTIGGLLKDLTGNYNYSFYSAGAFLLLSGLMCYPLQIVSDWEDERNKNKIKAPTQRKSLVL